MASYNLSPRSGRREARIVVLRWLDDPRDGEARQLCRGRQPLVWHGVTGSSTVRRRDDDDGIGRGRGQLVEAVDVAEPLAGLVAELGGGAVAVAVGRRRPARPPHAALERCVVGHRHRRRHRQRRRTFSCCCCRCKGRGEREREIDR